MSALDIIIACFCALIGFFIIFVSCGFFAFMVSLRRKGIAGKVINKKFQSELASYKIDYKWWETVPCENINFKIKNETISVTTIKNDSLKKVAILVHGYFGNFKDVSPWAKMFYEKGYNIIAPDLMSHGNSTGNKITMGFIEKNHLFQLILKSVDWFGKDCQIVLFGESMGGATVLMCSEQKLPKNVKCVVSDSAYSNAYKEMKHTISKRTFLPPFMFLPVANFFLFFFIKCNLKKVIFIVRVKKTSLPLLFIHGKSDKFVPSSMSVEMFEASNKKNCKLYLVESADHIKSYATNPYEYEKVVFSFVDNYVN